MLWDEPKIFFLERRYFFSIILSEFLKNRVALQERMLLLGGSFWYENSDGFCIRAEIPLRKTPGSEKRKQEETV